MKTILALVDFSDVTDAVVKAAAELAGTFKAEIYLLHVAAPDPDFVGYEAGPQTVRDSTARHLKEEHRQMHETEERLKKQGVNARMLVVQGPTVDKVLQEISRLKADVVVMGSHGHSALRNVLMGSVTEGVLRKAACPVLVVPRKKA